MSTVAPGYATANARFMMPPLTVGARRSVPLPKPQSTSSFVPSMYLWGNIAPGWKIVQLLPVRLERDSDGCHVMSDDLFAVYGEGHTRVEAQQDYVVALIDYYQLLEARADAPFAKAQLRRLQVYLHFVGE